MRDFVAKFTDDGSVGLFSNKINDIYHSSYGALSEAYEKFILPSNIKDFLTENNKIKILDICFGIGYNSKAFLNYFLENFHDNHYCIKSIDTDNIYAKNKYEIILHGVDIDENLIKISPFIKQVKKVKHKLVNQNKYYIKDEVNIILVESMIENFGSKYLNRNLTSFLNNKDHKKFFSRKMVNFALNYQKRGYQSSQARFLSRLLHNIYYKYISNSHKKAKNVLKTNKIDIQLFTQDARAFVTNSNTLYDYVFLDAFSPLKAPSLWTVQFIKKLHEITNENCMILTYSNSAAVRNAFLKNNFYVGKVFSSKNKKFVGTIATKNKDLIKISLNEFDLGLINTKAGICFEDETLSLTDSQIIENRKKEIEVSNLISATQFKKENKCSMTQL